MYRSLFIQSLAIGFFLVLQTAEGAGKPKFDIEKEEDHYRVETQEWILYSWASRSRTLDIAGQIQVVLHQVEDILQVKVPLESRLELRIFKDKQTFLNFSKEDLGEVFYMGGYCSPERNEVVTYDHGTIESLLALLSHELTHYFASKLYSSLPLWLNEGFADYIGFSRVRWGKMKGSEPSAVYLKRIKSAADAGTLIPLKDLIESDHYFEGHVRDLQYAQFWGLVYFLLEGDKQKYRHAFLEYMSELRKNPKTSLGQFIMLDAIDQVWVKELTRIKSAGYHKRPKGESIQTYRKKGA